MHGMIFQTCNLHKILDHPAQIVILLFYIEPFLEKLQGLLQLLLLLVKGYDALQCLFTAFDRSSFSRCFQRLLGV